MRVIWRIILSAVIVLLALILLANANQFVRAVFTGAGSVAMGVATDADQRLDIARRYAATVGVVSVIPWVLIIGLSFYCIKRVWRKKPPPTSQGGG